MVKHFSNGRPVISMRQWNDLSILKLFPSGLGWHLPSKYLLVVDFVSSTMLDSGACRKNNKTWLSIFKWFTGQSSFVSVRTRHVKVQPSACIWQLRAVSHASKKRIVLRGTHSNHNPFMDRIFFSWFLIIWRHSVLY